MGTLALIISFGAWLRWPHLQRGVVGDEQALLKYHGIDRILHDGSNALHPPFFRMSFRMFLEPMEGLEAGRLFSLVAALALIGMMAVVGRRLTGNRLAGLVTSLWCATLPIAIIFSTLFRPYSFWMLLVAGHIWAVIRWVRAGTKAQHRMPVIWTALLLPQVHYQSATWLAVFGLILVATKLIPWRRLWVYAPAALLFLPYTWFIFGPQYAQKFRKTGDLFSTWNYLLGMGLYDGYRPDFPSPFTALCVVVLVVTACHWRKLSVSTRVCLLGGVAMFGAVTFSISQHALTSSSRLLCAVFWLPLLVNFPSLLTQWYPTKKVGAGLVAAGMAFFIYRVNADRYEHDVLLSTPYDRLQQFTDNWKDLVPENHTVLFISGNNLRVARLVLTNTMDSKTPEEGCGTDRFCFVHEDRVWGKVSPDSIPSENLRPNVIVWTRYIQAPALPEHCSVIQSGISVAGIAHCRATGPQEENAHPVPSPSG